MSSTYKIELLKFMSFLNNTQYTREHIFSDEELLRIVPDDICRYMNIKAYHDPNPNENCRPTHARANTLNHIKKSLSNFMPRKRMQWDPIHNEGNPTRSSEVNDLIKRVQKFEVRREGVESSARRAIEYNEYINLLTITRMDENLKWRRFMVSSVLTLQWQIIGRIDDLMKLKFENISSNPLEESTLLCTMRWSKNILDERDAPEQIIIGSLDPRVCALLNLAVYIEIAAENQCLVSDFVYGNPDDGHRVIRQFLNRMFEKESFKKLKAGKLGTHSLRKGAATYASRCGVSKDFVNKRGRWRVKKSIVDVYIDPSLPYPDACTAAVLCGPMGACKYRFKDGLAIESSFLHADVVPGIKRVWGPAVANVLALPLLWAAFEDDTADYILLPERIRHRIRHVCRRFSFFERRINPVDRIPVQPAGNGDQMTLVELIGTQADDPGGDFPVGEQRRSTSQIEHQNSLTVMSQQLSLQRRIEDMHSSISSDVARLKSEVLQKFQIMNRCINRIALQPVTRPTAQTSTTDTSPDAIQVSSARLSKCPKDLYVLWKEYEFGVGGQKAAKDFTAAERGLNKFAFSRRKVFWDVVSHMVRSGYIADAAIDKIYTVYGNRLPVSSILKQMRDDRKNGGHPNLQL